jgi:hypothetical protein
MHGKAHAPSLSGERRSTEDVKSGQGQGKGGAPWLLTIVHRGGAPQVEQYPASDPGRVAERVAACACTA